MIALHRVKSLPELPHPQKSEPTNPPKEEEMQQVITLRSGAKVVTEIFEEDHEDEIVTHYIIYADGTLSTKTCTCTCEGKGSASKTCDASSNATCDCTGSSASISC